MSMAILSTSRSPQAEQIVSLGVHQRAGHLGELTADSPDLTLPVTGEPDQAVTNQEAVAYLLRWAGMEESQLAPTPLTTTPWPTAWA